MAAEKEESATAGEETELKKELQRVVEMILEKDDHGIELTIEAIRILSSLAELKLKKPVGLGMDNTGLPEEFKCSLSAKIVDDPVVVSSGQTYDRPHNQKWLVEGNLTCPLSKQVLSQPILTPKCLMTSDQYKESDIKMVTQCTRLTHYKVWRRSYIQSLPLVLTKRLFPLEAVTFKSQRNYHYHCTEVPPDKECAIALPESYQDIDGKTITELDRIHLNSLLEKMSSSLSDQKEAAKELRILTKTKRSYRASFREFTNAISRLLSPLSENNVASDPDLQEDLITTVLNISIHGNNKKVVADDPVAISVLIESMKFGTIETRRNAAAALFTLSALDSNKFIISNAGANVPLLELLCEGHPLAMKDAASAIFSLCIVRENKTKFIEIGAVQVIMQKIKDGILVDELSCILALLSTHQDAIDELGELDTLHCLLQIIRDSSSEHAKENCVAILYKVCSKDLTLLLVLRAQEMKKQTLAELAATGTTRARRKARGLIAKIRKSFSSFTFSFRK